MSFFQNRKISEAPSASEHRPASSGADKTNSPAQVSEIPFAATSERGTGIHEVHRALRDFQILLHTRRLYHHTHPKNLQSLEATSGSLQQLVQKMGGLEVRVERDALFVFKLRGAPLPDPKGELRHLAADFQLAGIQTLVVLRQFHVGELDTLTQLIRAALLKSKEPLPNKRTSWWSAKLLEYGVEGILVNAQTDRKVDTVLASLIAALVAFGGNAPRENADAPIAPPSLEDLSAVLRLLARLTPPWEAARVLSPEEAARSIHGALDEASRETVHMLLSAISQNGPRDAEKPQPYLLRLSEILVLEFIGAEFYIGQISPQAVRASIFKLADVLVTSGTDKGPHSSQHFSTLSTAWASEKH